MANTDAPFGLRPSRHISGGVIRMTEIRMAVSDTLGNGDPVRYTTSGKVTLATAGEPVLGVFTGFRHVDASNVVTYDQYYASGTANTNSVELTAFIIDDPYVVYQIQVDDDTTPLTSTLTYIGKNIDMLAHAAANANTKQSVGQLDASTFVSGIAQFKILNLYNAPDNVSDGNGNEIVEVLINEHNWAVTGRLAQTT